MKNFFIYSKYCEIFSIYQHFNLISDLKEMDMRFGTWNVRSPYRPCSLMTVAKEIPKYKLDLVGVQEVRWDGGGTEPAGECTFFYGKENENRESDTSFLHTKITIQ
jgi:hypothetical protein